MDTLRLISQLLDYPQQDLMAHSAEIQSIIDAADLPKQSKQGLSRFVEHYSAMDLLDWQAEYDGLFERGRSLGLWLFEHVHGESRDRGQAMVELMGKYKEAGLELSRHELPDYIPLFLEFLATQGADNARLWLSEVVQVLALLQVRLERRDSLYCHVMSALVSYSKAKVDLEDLRSQTASEKRDDSKQALDKEWEEEEVTFGADSLQQSCDQATNRPSNSQRRDLDAPLHWVDFEQGQAASDVKGANQ